VYEKPHTVCHMRDTKATHTAAMRSLDANTLSHARFVLSVTAYEWLHPKESRTAAAFKKKLRTFQLVLRAIIRLGTRSRFAKPLRQRRTARVSAAL
jgi:hypothetical protein